MDCAIEGRRLDARSKMRRISLPVLSSSQRVSSYQSAASGGNLDAAALLQAHGIITEMLADTSTLPPKFVSGLKALANLIPPQHGAGGGGGGAGGVGGGSGKARFGHLLSIPSSASPAAAQAEEEESPFTGEKPSTLPKKSLKNVSPSLLRRVSTSTWTTTTSATGLPTLDPEPWFQELQQLVNQRNRSKSDAQLHRHSGSDLYLNPRSPENYPNLVDLAVVLHSSNADYLVCPHCSQTIITQGVKTSPGERQLPAEDPNACIFSQRPFLYDSLTSLCDLRLLGDENLRPQLPGDSRLKPPELLQDHPIPQGTGSGAFVKKSFEGEDPTRPDSPSLAQLQHQEANSAILEVYDATRIDIQSLEEEEVLHGIQQWDFPIFDVASQYPVTMLSSICYRIFKEVGLFEIFQIPLQQFFNYFHALEMGYKDIPYHNRIHAADVVHACYYLTSQPVPGLETLSQEGDKIPFSTPETPAECVESPRVVQRVNFEVGEEYGILGANYPAFELMALYTAAAMHDYNHPGRTNAFLVSTFSPLAVLYNDRSVLENYHSALSWKLLLSRPEFNFLCNLDDAEFKRFRYLVIDAILATDLKRHFEILTEFNSKMNGEVGLNFALETDRLLAMQMCIKLADINAPCKPRDLHRRWTNMIVEEFYEQGDEESRLGLSISPYMDRNNPQLARLQDSFINHLVAPLCNALADAGLLPGLWVEEGEAEDEEQGAYAEKGDPESFEEGDKKLPGRRIFCLLTSHLEKNHEHWTSQIQKELEQKTKSTADSSRESPPEVVISVAETMETIQEEEKNVSEECVVVDFEKKESKL